MTGFMYVKRSEQVRAKDIERLETNELVDLYEKLHKQWERLTKKRESIDSAEKIDGLNRGGYRLKNTMDTIRVMYYLEKVHTEMTEHRLEITTEFEVA